MPQPTTDYGIDIAMNAELTGMDPSLKSVSGRRCLSEALVRRLQTDNGRLIDDPDYGYNLLGEINDDIGPAELGRIASMSAAECLKDERVEACSAEASFTMGVLTVGLLVTDSQGPFRLVVAARDATVSLLQVTA